MAMYSNSSYYSYIWFWLIWSVSLQDWMNHLINVFFVCSDSFGLFYYRTKWIYQFSHWIFHCLSVHSDLVCSNCSTAYMIYVQINNLPLINEGHLVWIDLRLFVSLWLLGTSFFVVTMATTFFLVSHSNQFFFVTKELFARGNFCLVTNGHFLFP